MERQTRITVPVDQMAWITNALTDAGITVLDTGDRVTTEESVAAEAVLCVAQFEAATAEASIREPPIHE